MSTKLVQKPLLHISICECGDSTLHDYIKLGTVYVLDMETLRDGGYYRCGKCGTEQKNVQCVKAARLKTLLVDMGMLKTVRKSENPINPEQDSQPDPDLSIGWLPYGLFAEAA